jgi:hypothetical protein
MVYTVRKDRPASVWVENEAGFLIARTPSQLVYSAKYRNILKSSRHSLVSATYGLPLVSLACPPASKCEIEQVTGYRLETWPSDPIYSLCAGNIVSGRVL